MKDDRPTSPPREHDISASGDRYEALAEFLEQHATQTARDRQRETEERRERQERSSTRYWLLGVLLLLTFWLWIFPPAFLRVDPPPPQPIAEEEAALRFAMYVQAQRIKGYQEETGQYPDRLEDAGPPLPGMNYLRLGTELYQLTGETDRLRLTYRSDLPLSEFVGSGAELVDNAL